MFMALAADRALRVDALFLRKPAEVAPAEPGVRLLMRLRLWTA